jgi:hypothetical protein
VVCRVAAFYTYDLISLVTSYTYDPASQVTNILHQLTATNTQINQAALSRPPVR